MDILQIALNNEYIDSSVPEYKEFRKVAERSAELLTKFNSQYLDKKERQQLISEVIQKPVPETTDINSPFNSDFGQHIFFGEHDFINKDCLFVDLGGIYLGDNVMIGPRTTLVSVNHAEEPEHRTDLVLKAVHIEDGAWLGAGVMVMPGVTIGKNAIIGAGSIVTKDIPANMVAVGNPARVIREVKTEHNN